MSLCDKYDDSSDTWQVGRSVMLDPDPDQAACENQQEEIYPAGGLGLARR